MRITHLDEGTEVGRNPNHYSKREMVSGVEDDPPEKDINIETVSNLLTNREKRKSGPHPKSKDNND